MGVLLMKQRERMKPSANGHDDHHPTEEELTIIEAVGHSKKQGNITSTDSNPIAIKVRLMSAAPMPTD